MKTLNYKVEYKINNTTKTTAFETFYEVEWFIASLSKKEWSEIGVLKNEPGLLREEAYLLWAINDGGMIRNDSQVQYELVYELKYCYSNELILKVNKIEPNQEPGTKTEEVEITEDDIKWIGDNIFHLVYAFLIKSKGNSENITFNYIKDEIIKKSWDRKSQFILSYARVYPLDAVEKYLAKDGRTIEDVFELWKQIAIKDYNNED